MRARDDDLWNVACDLRGFQIVTVEKKQYVRREIDPPIRRLDFCDGGRVIGSLLREGRERDGEDQEKKNGNSPKIWKIHLESAGGRNFNLPKAVGTWKFGCGVLVGRQEE